MQKISIPIICITFIMSLFIGNALLAWVPPNKTMIEVALFSKEPHLNHICVDSHATLTPGHILLKPNEKWCLKSDKDRITLYQSPGPLSNHVPKKATLSSNALDPICISTSNIETRCYHGTIEVISEHKKIKVINTVSLADYLHSTVGSELPHGWPEEAVKAQTVATHSYMLYTLKHNKVIKDSTDNQFYGGVRYEKPEYNLSIDEVKNVVMVDGRKEPIEALFHSTCAGGTLNNDDVFGGTAISYLRSVPCDHCKASNFYKTLTKEMTRQKMNSLFDTDDLSFIHKDDGELKAIKLKRKTISRYQGWLHLGKVLGWGNVPGIKYNIQCTDNFCKITSRGAGHAVGLCQWGARGLAKTGCKYQDILRYYYKNVFFQ